MNPRHQVEAGNGDPTHTVQLDELALNAALGEFKIAAAAVIDRIKAGEHLPKLELDREWNARHQLLEPRQLVDRLANRRKAFSSQK